MKEIFSRRQCDARCELAAGGAVHSPSTSKAHRAHTHTPSPSCVATTRTPRAKRTGEPEHTLTYTRRQGALQLCRYRKTY